MMQERNNDMNRTLGSAIDEWLQTFWVFGINEVDERGIDPATSFDRVETTYNKIELHVIVIVLVLNFSKVSR